MNILKTNDGGMLSAMCFKGIAEMVTGSGAAKARKAAAANAARQEQLQKESLDAQNASQLRTQNKLDEQEADLQKTAAGQRRAIVARRKGRGALAFTPAGGLKSKLGE